MYGLAVFGKHGAVWEGEVGGEAGGSIAGPLVWKTLDYLRVTAGVFYRVKRCLSIRFARWILEFTHEIITYVVCNAEDTQLIPMTDRYSYVATT